MKLWAIAPFVASGVAISTSAFAFDASSRADCYAVANFYMSTTVSTRVFVDNYSRAFAFDGRRYVVSEMTPSEIDEIANAIRACVVKKTVSYDITEGQLRDWVSTFKNNLPQMHEKAEQKAGIERQQKDDYARQRASREASQRTKKDAQNADFERKISGMPECEGVIPKMEAATRQISDNSPQRLGALIAAGDTDEACSYIGKTLPLIDASRVAMLTCSRRLEGGPDSSLKELSGGLLSQAITFNQLVSALKSTSRQLACPL